MIAQLYQTSDRAQNVSLSESKLMLNKQESDIKCELTYSTKERTNSDLTTQDTHSEDSRQDPNQSLSEPEFQEVNPKGFLPGTLLQEKADQMDLGTYIKSLIGKLEEISSMLPEKNAVTDLSQDIMTKFAIAMESVDLYLKNQEKNQVTVPSREVSNVDSLNSLDLNQDFPFSDEANHRQLESHLVQIRSESCNLNDTNLSGLIDPQCFKFAYDHDPTGKFLFVFKIELIKGLHEALKHENEKPQDCIQAGIMRSTYVVTNKIICNHTRNPHEEVSPIRKVESAPNDKNRDIPECLTTNSRRTILKKQESKPVEPAYKTVTFMDPNPAGSMAERFKLKPGQIGKSTKKPMRRILGNAGWD